MELNDSTRDHAIQEIATFSSNFGGTDILSPMKKVQSDGKMQKAGTSKRVFLLTDGAVGSPEQVVNYARKHCETTRVYSFGLGSGCDKTLVHDVARMGRGTSTIVEDDAPNLNGLVVQALKNAMQPSLGDVEFGYNGALC